MTFVSLINITIDGGVLSTKIHDEQKLRNIFMGCLVGHHPFDV